MPRPPSRIELWIVELDSWAERGLNASTLDTSDRLQAQHLRDAKGGCRLLARRAVTRWILAGALGVAPSAVLIERVCPTCGATTHGRPSVRGAGIEFSVSSSGPLATVAVSQLPIGVDAEIDRSDIGPLAFALSDDEQRGIRAAAPDMQGLAFLHLWTAKEAVLKAAGTSMDDGLAAVDVSGLLSADHTTTVYRDLAWKVRTFSIEPRAGVTATVAVADQGGAGILMKCMHPPPVARTLATEGLPAIKPDSPGSSRTQKSADAC